MTSHPHQSSPAPEPLSVDEAIDAAPIGPALIAMLVLCALVMMIDGYDLAAMPLTLPYVARLWAVPPSDFSWALSAVLVGLGAGAVLLAPLGDRLGRRPAIIVATATIGAVTLGTSLSSSVTAFIVWRFLTGLALGACLPNVTALVAELTPKRRRATLLTVVSCGISIGAIGAGFVVPSLVAHGGWQTVFLVPGIATLLLAGLLFRRLPESPKYLLTHRSREPSLVRLLKRFRIAGSTTKFAPPARVNEPPKSFLAPLTGPFRFATLVFTGLYTINAFALYLLVSWVPTLLPQVGFSQDEASRLAAVLQIGGLLAGLSISWFLDRANTVAALMSAYGLIALALCAFSVVAPTNFGWGLLLLIAGGGISGAHVALMAVGASFFPAAVLSSAIGVAVAVARIGAILGPLIGGQLIKAGVGPAPFFLVAVVPVLLCMGFITLIPAVKRSRGLA